MTQFDAEWPDATQVVTEYLTDAVPTPVRWSVPNPRPNEFVVVRRTGNAGAPRWTERAVLDVECWSGQANGSPKPAHRLAGQVARALFQLPSGDNPVTDVSLTGRAYFPDPTSQTPRVTLGVAVLLRPHSAT